MKKVPFFRDCIVIIDWMKLQNAVEHQSGEYVGADDEELIAIMVVDGLKELTT